MDLKESLLDRKFSIEACVVVGGTLLHDCYPQLKQCVERGVKLRMLFPGQGSTWLTPLVTSAQTTIEEYQQKIISNCKRAQDLGSAVEIRWHTSPITKWFVILDKVIVVSKPVDFMQQTFPAFEDRSILDYYSTLFNTIWSKSSNSFYEENYLRVKLKEKVARFFDDSEIKEMCFALGIDYEILSGANKSEKVISLILHLERRSSIRLLVEYCNKHRAQIDW